MSTEEEKPSITKHFTFGHLDIIIITSYFLAPPVVLWMCYISGVPGDLSRGFVDIIFAPIKFLERKFLWIEQFYNAYHSLFGL